MSRDGDIPLDVVACDLGVFSDEEGERHAALLAAFRAAVTAREDVAGGYRYRFDGRAFADTAAWIGYERRCCAFFRFVIEWPAGEAPVLDITGPPGAKEILEPLWPVSS